MGSHLRPHFHTMYFRLTRKEDLLSVFAIYQKAIAFMRENKNQEQWSDFSALQRSVTKDVFSQISYVLIDEEEIKAVFTLLEEEEETYKEIDGKWKDDSTYFTIHRLAVVEHKKGYASMCFDYAFLKNRHIRIDTHKDNLPMQKLILKEGFSCCGTITLKDGTERLAYEKKADFSDLLLAYYHLNKRDLPWRKRNDFYAVYVSEIMLQQTRTEKVKEYYTRFLSVLLTLEDLAEAEEDVYLKLWEGLGYYSRVKNLHRGAEYILSNHLNTSFMTKEDLLSIPGIGEYTASAIASICFDQKEVSVDGNLLRVFSRLTCYPLSIKSAMAKKDCALYFQEKMKKDYGQFNQALMDIGATLCLANAKSHCERCPLSFFCKAYNEDKVDSYPKKEEKKEKKIEEKTIFLLSYKGRIFIQKRKEKGLLASLYEFYNVDGKLSLSEAKERLSKDGFIISSIDELQESRFVFSHIIWKMNGYHVELAEEKKNALFASKEDILKKYSFPSALSDYLSFLESDIGRKNLSCLDDAEKIEDKAKDK